MYFRQILHEEKACASYMVGCPTLGLCVVVDPQGEPASYIDKAEWNAMTISGVIETHIHADHISTGRELAQRTGAPLYLGPGAQVRFNHQTLVDGQVLEVGNRRIRVIHAPGHTPEHICLFVDDWFVLTGDTLFIGDVGRVDLSLDGIDQDAIRARALALQESLKRLASLPDCTEVYPGHYAGSVCGRGMDGKTISTIGHERHANKPWQLSREAFIEFQLTNTSALPENFHAIKSHNIGDA